MDHQGKAYFTSEDVAGLCNVSMIRVEDWIHAGQLPACQQPRGGHRIKRLELRRFLEAEGLPIPPEIENASALRVVVVDDEPMVRAVVAGILESMGGMEVAVAADGFEAGKCVAELRPDAVILDLRMPGMDGATVCRRIKNDPRTAHTRVLFLTGYTDPDHLATIRECGADGYVSKPFAAADLIEAVRGVAQHEVPAGPVN